MRRKQMKWGVGLCSLAMLFSVLPANAATNTKKPGTEREQTYLVRMEKEQEKTTREKLKQTYEVSSTCSTQAEDELEENQLMTVEMTPSEAAKLKKNSAIRFVEKDVTVKACTTAPAKKTISTGSLRKSEWEKAKNNRHEKKETRKADSTKSNREVEWNRQMIRAEKALSNIKKEKQNQGKEISTTKSNDSHKQSPVKIAVLDSGVDYWSDINLEESITLVPKEEEMSLLFMDGTGHGNSVAGLIAAKENGEGITGVNPGAALYSIRVLDNNNTAPISRIIEGIYMAIERKVDIINMSFGVSTYSAALEQAVKDAAEAGILLIAAAGNTGEKGVQYPAAFPEVIAVGSVDKEGNLAEQSSVGEEVELTAPGELVMSTGNFGDVQVASGTSLAAPQVAGVASLLWERDISMPADFIRQVLTLSANRYGNCEQYGYGLLDAQYAMEQYDTLKKQYEESKDAEEKEVPLNTRKIVTFDETGCVEGNWLKNNHEDLIPSKYTWLKKGARYPDEDANMAKMKTNPWWHGYWKKTSGSTPYKVNYVTSYLFATRLANSLYTGAGSVKCPTYVNTNVYNAMCSQFNMATCSKVLPSSTSKANKRAFAWGFALHSLSDTFAHSACLPNGTAITHDNGADNKNHIKARYTAAQKAVTRGLERFNTSPTTEGTYKEFSVIQNSTTFYLVNIYDYVKDGIGSNSAIPYARVSVRKN